MTVRAMKAGAADFLTKPVDGAELLDRLTGREKQTLQLALKGWQNKEIARHLGISHRTVEIHRSHILQKTGTANMLELSAIARANGVLNDTPTPDDTTD